VVVKCQLRQASRPKELRWSNVQLSNMTLPVLVSE